VLFLLSHDDCSPAAVCFAVRSSSFIQFSKKSRIIQLSLFVILLCSIMWRAQCSSIFKQRRSMHQWKSPVVLETPRHASPFSTTPAASNSTSFRSSCFNSSSSPRRLLAASFNSLLPRRRNHSTAASSSAATATSPLECESASNCDPAPQEIFRADYRPPSFSVSHVDLSFQLGLEDTVVTTRSSIARMMERRADSSRTSTSTDLVLDGGQQYTLTLTLTSIAHVC
jgi:hypothetical protein